MISCRRISASLCSTDARFRHIFQGEHVLPCGCHLQNVRCFEMFDGLHCLHSHTIASVCCSWARRWPSPSREAACKKLARDVTCNLSQVCVLKLHGSAYPPIFLANICILPVQRGLEVVGHDHWHTSMRHDILTIDCGKIRLFACSPFLAVIALTVLKHVLLFASASLHISQCVIVSSACFSVH